MGDLLTLDDVLGSGLFCVCSRPRPASLPKCICCTSINNATKKTKGGKTNGRKQIKNSKRRNG